MKLEQGESRQEEHLQARPWWASMKSHQDIFFLLELTHHERTCVQTAHKIQLLLLVLRKDEKENIHIIHASLAN